jgi:hypothetical protein
MRSCMESLGGITSSIPLQQVAAAWRLCSATRISLILLHSLIYLNVPLIKIKISLYKDKQN